MIGYCEGCNKQVKGTKKEFSWGAFFLGLGIIYSLYRVLFCYRNRCPICGLKLRRKPTVANDEVER